jgi:hypothetical protein
MRFFASYFREITTNQIRIKHKYVPIVILAVTALNVGTKILRYVRAT